MVDKVTELLLDVLKQALTESGEHRLFRTGKLDGLFPSRTALAGLVGQSISSAASTPWKRCGASKKTAHDPAERRAWATFFRQANAGIFRRRGGDGDI